MIFDLKKRRWTSKEKQKFAKLIQEGYDHGEISKKLDRTILSLKQKNWTQIHLRIKKRLRKKENLAGNLLGK